jgi:hypothetical protein
MVPCGLEGRPVTSLNRLSAVGGPPQMGHIKWLLGNAIVSRLSRAATDIDDGEGELLLAD